MKKWIIGMLTMILCIITPLAAFAQNTETRKSKEGDFILELDATDTSEKVYVINGIEFRVLPTAIQSEKNATIQGGVNATKKVKITDLYNNANLGTVVITATCIYDGKIVGATDYKSYIIDKPTSSDLKVTKTEIEGNNTSMLKVHSWISFTNSKGKSSSGRVSLFVYANGYYD